jgi:hypothetical protein
MINVCLKRALSAALGLALLSAAAPMALADPPGYLFQDFAQSVASNSKPAPARMATSEQTKGAQGHGGTRTN